VSRSGNLDLDLVVDLDQDQVQDQDQDQAQDRVAPWVGACVHAVPRGDAL
jgi:hypothetical protein